MKIPLVDLRAGYEPLRDEISKAIGSVLEGMNLFLGPNVSALEEEFASYCGTKYAIGVGSGTEAIQFALLACNVKQGDEVITTPHTFFATAEAILCIGAKPVFVDIDPLTYNIDPDEVRKKIRKKTKAIIPVHMYGQMADMAPIIEMARKKEICVIEDSCQAHGALYKGKKAGSAGSAGCFSFYFTKNLGCYGEGGMVTTNDDRIAELVRLYRNHGHKSKHEHSVAGYNGRLDEIQAAILRIKLKHLDEYNRQRGEKAEQYNALLKDSALGIPVIAKDRTHVYHLYVVRAKKRDKLQEYLARNDIGTGIHYKNPVHLQGALKCFRYKKGDFPVAENVCSEILSLPIYPELTCSQIEYVAKKIKDFYGGG